MSDAERDDRFLRYSGIVNPSKLLNSHVLVLGVGAIGRQVALQLAAMGVGSVELCDMDTVEEVNLGAQGYKPSQLGETKVHSTLLDMHDINPDMDIYPHAIEFDYSFNTADYTAVFVCVDCMDARKAAFEKCEADDVVLIDTRMSGLTAQAYYVGYDDARRRKYETTLFSNEEAYPEPCTARSVLFTSNIIAGLAVSLWAQSLRSELPYPFLSLSLTDYTLDPIEIQLPTEEAVLQPVFEATPFPTETPSEDAAPTEPPSET